MHGLVYVRTLACVGALHQSRKQTDGEVHARVGVAQGGAGLRRDIVGTAVPAGCGSGGGRNLSHRLVCFKMCVTRAYRESLYGTVDAAGVELVHFLPAESQLVHCARVKVLDEYVGGLDQFGQNGLAVGSGSVKCQRLLAAVQLQEVIAGAIGIELKFVTGSVTGTGTLDLDDFGSKPSQQLCT